MHCKWKEHLFIGCDDIAWDIVRYEFMIHLFLHTRYSQVCLLTVSLANGLDYRCNLELLVLVDCSLQAGTCINCFSSGMTCSVVPFWERLVLYRFRVLRTSAWYSWSPGFRSWHWDQVSSQVSRGVLHHLETNSGMVSYFQSCYGRILQCLYRS